MVVFSLVKRWDQNFSLVAIKLSFRFVIIVILRYESSCSISFCYCQYNRHLLLFRYLTIYINLKDGIKIFHFLINRIFCAIISFKIKCVWIEITGCKPSDNNQIIFFYATLQIDGVFGKNRYFIVNF
jgi:hypothetical protein